MTLLLTPGLHTEPRRDEVFLRPANYLLATHSQFSYQNTPSSEYLTYP